ncbi:hypothetical protein niasHT_028076 [Heterodera trifolii]|uniref:DAGKc domain-containing protein n=1 Tax=Heterodera trifolii TaxID=157864 RepID=A0ABD2KF77_9BILA
MSSLSPSPSSFSAKLFPLQNPRFCCPSFCFSPSPIPFKWPPSASDHPTPIASNSDCSFCLFSDDIVSVRTVPHQSQRAEEEGLPAFAPSSPHLLLSVCPLIRPSCQRRLLRFALLPDHPSQLVPLQRSLALWLRHSFSLDSPPHSPSSFSVSSSLSLRVLVLLNPFSGQKRALHLWRTEVEPLWREAGISYELRQTEGPEHAIRVAAELDLDSFGMLALGGGDGLICEAINGLFHRADFRRAIRLPLLHLPMGTGNSLAASVAFMANEPFPPRGTFCSQMALMALRPSFRRLRLYRAEFSQNRSKMMFLSLSWGLLADIDLGSERFRRLGMLRLHLEAFLRIAQLPSVAFYRARLSYLPISDGPELCELERKLRFGVDVRRGAFGDGHFEDEGEEEEDAGGEEEEEQMPPLNEPIPSHWLTIDGEFCFVLLSALSHLGSDIPFVPSARPQDSVLYLSFVRWKNLRSRVHMARILLSINSSAHLEDPAFEVIPVKACRIQPAPGMGGFVALDGEQIENEIGQSFQVMATRWCATVAGQRERQREGRT